jgi:hypothetical protein
MMPFFEWCETTLVGTVVRESLWLFPAIEAIHLVGLTLLGGSLLVVDLRLLGLGLTTQPIAEIAVAAQRWTVIAIAVMVATGVPLFLSEAVKCYYNPSFWVKMTTLPVALLFTFAIRQPMARNPRLVTSARSRILAVGSLGLWFVVAAAGRWIGFSS